MNSASFTRWNALIPHVNAFRGFIVSDPNTGGTAYAQGVNPGRWSTRLGIKTSGGIAAPYAGTDGHVVLANAIIARLTHPEAPSFVMVDELSAITNGLVGNTAGYLGAGWAGRWGAYITPGEKVSYSSLTFGLGNLFNVGARVAPAFYIPQNPPRTPNYCQSGGDSGSRDQWLTRYFLGGGPGIAENRMRWLADYRADGFPQSTSRIFPIFGVNDTYLNGLDAGKMLDRMFYVWVNFLDRPGEDRIRNMLYDINDGGVGSWKWQSPSVGEGGTQTTSRDELFVASYNHYCRSPYNRTSRLGTVIC